MINDLTTGNGPDICTAMERETDRGNLRFDPFTADLICTNPDGVELRRNKEGDFFLVRIDHVLRGKKISTLEILQRGGDCETAHIRRERTITPLSPCEAFMWGVETLLPEELRGIMTHRHEKNRDRDSVE